MIVMEDDVSIDDEFPEVVSFAGQHLGEKEFIRFASTNVGPGRARPVPWRSLQALTVSQGSGGDDVLRSFPEGARKLLAKADRWIEPVDDYLGRF